MPDADAPFPFEAARDLLGIARALYVTFKGMGPAYDTHRSKVASIGSQLQRAIEKAQKGGPGTWNQKTAWLMAEKAAQDLGALVDKYLPASVWPYDGRADVLIRASGERLRKRT